jgi:outer membrane lipoprotein-sorting protein
MRKVSMKLMLRTGMIVVLASLTLARAADVDDARAVLHAMHDRYQASWYKGLTFTQKSTTYNQDGTSTAEIWHEALLLPGKLRIDKGNPTDGNGALVLDGAATFFRGGKITGTRPLVNMLLVLGFDVYGQDPETTIKVVKGEGYDLTKLREDTWEGRAVYVVGADKGDLNSRQFWVQKDTLLFVREIEPSRGDPKKLDDIRFTDYRPLAGGWLAAGVEVYSDGKKVFSEEYSEIQANPKLNPAMFDPQQYSNTYWENQ